MATDNNLPVKTFHKASYTAISTSNPALSQAGRTVVVTGSSGGIGLAIARGFAEAQASTVILTGRTATTLSAAASALAAEFPKTRIVHRLLDISDIEAVDAFWDSLDAQDTLVDVLVLSAARVSMPMPIVKLGHREARADFEVNVGSNATFADRFYNQAKRNTEQKLFLVNLSTLIIHDINYAAHFPNYSASKAAGTMLLQNMSYGVFDSDMQIVSFHPGAIFTPGASKAGFTEDSLPYDNESLPGHFAVWAASDDASFLHGRFVWASWDVEELKSAETRERISNDASYLRIGVNGL
ncbi:hypothetical protein NLG97_g2353 [Lecanicillium saksenae]|uniref:Uncharacterized protein n=1 Tax=Lecanicillium saksenae TaxID=468837 RepID=A0ACC1R301_9HYPO|nr:hypothetical protein NLG97_g2353 [Lecanicillium saksenae]